MRAAPSMALAGSVASTPSEAAVAGISCIRPIAPAGLTASGRYEDSTKPTAARMVGEMPWRSPAATNSAAYGVPAGTDGVAARAGCWPVALGGLVAERPGVHLGEASIGRRTCTHRRRRLVGGRCGADHGRRGDEVLRVCRIASRWTAIRACTDAIALIALIAPHPWDGGPRRGRRSRRVRHGRARSGRSRGSAHPSARGRRHGEP